MYTILPVYCINLFTCIQDLLCKIPEGVPQRHTRNTNCKTMMIVWNRWWWLIFIIKTMSMTMTIWVTSTCSIQDEGGSQTSLSSSSSSSKSSSPAVSRMRIVAKLLRTPEVGFLTEWSCNTDRWSGWWSLRRDDDFDYDDDDDDGNGNVGDYFDYDGHDCDGDDDDDGWAEAKEGVTGFLWQRHRVMLPFRQTTHDHLWWWRWSPHHCDDDRWWCDGHQWSTSLQLKKKKLQRWCLI